MNRICRWENSKGLSSKKIPSSVPRLPRSDQWVSTANRIIPFPPKIWKPFLRLWLTKETQTVTTFTRRTRRNFQCWHFWKIKDNLHEEILLFVNSYTKLITIYYFFLSIFSSSKTSSFGLIFRHELNDIKKK